MQEFVDYPCPLLNSTSVMSFKIHLTWARARCKHASMWLCFNGKHFIGRLALMPAQWRWFSIVWSDTPTAVVLCKSVCKRVTVTKHWQSAWKTFFNSRCHPLTTNTTVLMPGILCVRRLSHILSTVLLEFLSTLVAKPSYQICNQNWIEKSWKHVLHSCFEEFCSVGELLKSTCLCDESLSGVSW
jgi:hypothetical protein